MKISKCCKGLVHDGSAPEIYCCQRCWLDCQFWELDDCEILLKGELDELKKRAEDMYKLRAATKVFIEGLGSRGLAFNKKGHLVATASKFSYKQGQAIPRKARRKKNK